MRSRVLPSILIVTLALSCLAAVAQAERRATARATSMNQMTASKYVLTVGERYRLHVCLLDDATLPIRSNPNVRIVGRIAGRVPTSAMNAYDTFNDGTYIITNTAYYSGVWYGEFTGDATYAPSRSAEVNTYCKASLGAPRLSPTRPRAGRAVTFTTTMRPLQTGGSTVQVQGRKNGAWRWAVKTAALGAAPSGMYDSGSVRKALRLARGTYRVRFYHRDADHWPSYSPWKSFAVR